MTKKPSLAESMRQAVQGSEPPPSTSFPSISVSPVAAPKAALLKVEAEAKPKTAFFAATRAGKKRVTAPLSPEDHKRLRRLALDRDATSEELLTEAIHDLFAKYKVAKAGQGAGSR